jgi:hypothetical protein
MDGTPCERDGCPFARSLQAPNGTHSPERSAEADSFFRILHEADRGEWRVTQWADELTITVDEMLIELDRHLHQGPRAEH